MTEAVETFKFDHGVTAELFYDDDAPDPRADFDHLATMVCWHRRSLLGDEQVRAPDFESISAIAEHYEFEVWQPLWLYDHSGLRMQTTDEKVNPFHDEWDSGMVGIIGVTQEEIDKEYPLSFPHDADAERQEQAVREMFKAEVDEYDQYLSGQVYGYVVTDRDGETLDSCWGFFGAKYAEEEAKASAEQFAKTVGNDEDAKELWEAFTP